MKNADMPAMPTEVQALSRAMSVAHDNWGKAALGLTKREMIAMHVMQGLISAWGAHDVTSGGELASDAVAMADSLLAELERTK